MRRRSLLGGALGAALAAPAVARAAPKLRWRLTSGFPRTLDVLFGGADAFAAQVATMTGGAFRIEIFPSGELVRPRLAVEAVGTGTVEMAHTAASYYWGTDPAFALGTTPFGPNARLMNAWLYRGGGNDLLNAFFAGHNLYGLPGGNTGVQMGGWWRREVGSLADLQGARMRIGTIGAWAGGQAGPGGLVVEKLGVVPQRIATADIYPALERGTIDAAEYVGPYDDAALDLHRVAPHYYYPAFWEAGPSLHFFVNLQRWNALPADYRAVLTTAAACANVDMLARYDARNAAALRALVARGAQLKPFPGDVMAAGLAAANEIHERLAAENADFRAIYDSQRAFRNEGYLWLEVADHAYDRFMIRSRSEG